MNYEEILENAHQAGMKAFKACIPVPVSWVSSDLDDKPLGPPSEPDLEGECGGAYISGLHGKDPFVRWALKNKPDFLKKGVYKGYDILHLKIDNYNGQSFEKRSCYAEAYARILYNNGIKCFAKNYLT